MPRNDNIQRAFALVWKVFVFVALTDWMSGPAWAQKGDLLETNVVTQPVRVAGFTHGQYGIALISIVAVVVCVLLHYEVLKWLSHFLSHLRKLHRTRVLILILGLMLVHLIEIWLYALGYGLVDRRGVFGHLQGKLQEGWLDYVYFSFVTYATVGYGDIVPVGPIRFLAAQEALSGVVLIAWSASFTFLEMGRFWREPDK